MSAGFGCSNGSGGVEFPWRSIDLLPAEVGGLCLCCEDAAAVLRDRECGPVCGPCFAALIAVERVLDAAMEGAK